MKSSKDEERYVIFLKCVFKLKNFYTYTFSNGSLFYNNNDNNNNNNNTNNNKIIIITIIITIIIM